MSALASEHGAVNLGQGFPDFGCDPRLLDLVDAAMRANLNQYPLMTGVPALREARSPPRSRPCTAMPTTPTPRSR
jgi:methionine aminotransferase